MKPQAKKNEKKKKEVMIIIQITILLISTFAISYFLSDEISIVSGQEIKHTCKETKDGGICQEFTAEQCNDFCKENCFPGTREQYSECKLGCCYDIREGTCIANTPKFKCEESGGEWHDDANCNLPKCSKGCCVLGSNTAFVTEQRCKRLSALYGLPIDFRPNIASEAECIALAQEQTYGACIIEQEERLCIMTTQAECLKDGGRFYEGYLCTAELLNTTCKPTTQTTCVEGKDEVYFVDSCGNIANIYDASKVNDKSYWEKIVPKEESCGYGSSNANSAMQARIAQDQAMVISYAGI